MCGTVCSARTQWGWFFLVTGRLAIAARHLRSPQRVPPQNILHRHNCCHVPLAEVSHSCVVTCGMEIMSPNHSCCCTSRVWIMFCYWLRLQFAEGKVEKAWNMKRGNLSSFGLDLAGYDSAKQAAVLRNDSVFEVEFSADRASVVVRCFSDSFSSKSQPDTLCGENQHRGQFSQAGQGSH